MSTPATALIADDEPLLRKSLRRLLGQAWPELEIVAEARNGREAVVQFEKLQPRICFLDVHMPGLSGVEAAAQIGRRAQLVFVTAYDQYAVQAFNHGAVDYLVKPLDVARLAETVSRLKERLPVPQPPENLEALLKELAAGLKKEPTREPLRWIHASVGSALRVIATEDLDFLRSDDRYTTVAYHADGKACEALVRTPLKDLVELLDPQQFVQVHRSVMVNRRSISHVARGDNETLQIHLKGRTDVLPVSRTYNHLFKQM